MQRFNSIKAGGAAANLYAAHLNNTSIKSGSSWKNHLNKDDIYAYTFGAIKVFMSNNNVEFGYENIHNVYNYYDSFGPHGSKEWLHVSDPKAKFGHTDMFNIGKIEEGSNILDAVHNHDMSRYIEALKAKEVSCSGKQQFKVVFKPNKGRGIMDPQLINRNKKTALRTAAYQRTGYKFAGWNTRKDGKGKAYKDEQKVKGLAATGKTVTLYAQWRKATTTSYKISTPYYSLTIPKIWRDKVQWKTTVSYVRQCKYENYRMIYSGKKYKFYATSFYLKGHKGDESYWLARIGAGRSDCENDLTGFNSDKTSILVKNNGRHRVYLLAANMPVRIGWHYNARNDWARTLIPNSEANQKKMLKLTVGTTAYYNALKKWEASTGDWNDSSLYFNRVNKYLEPRFKNAIKVK